MINAIQDGELLADLDAKTFNLRNCNELTGADNIVYGNDSRMTNARSILDGTVTDDSVADNAGIVQSKLNLNGTIPPQYLGKMATEAAQGDVVQFVSQKDQPNGYPSLGMDGKMPTGSVPLSGSGTVTKFNLALPYEFLVAPNVSTSDWTFTALWGGEPQSWYGNNSGSSARPKFNSTQIPLSLISNLDASDFSTGTFDPARLPLAVGVGVGHAIGVIPVTDGDAGLPQDYLARDMTFKRMGAIISYEPVLPDPAITILYYTGPVAMVNVTESVKGTNLFYKMPFSFSTVEPFTQITKLPLKVPIGTTVMVYAAKVGYTNSNIVKLKIPDPTIGAPYA